MCQCIYPTQVYIFAFFGFYLNLVSHRTKPPPLTNSFKVLLEKFLRFESDFELQQFEKQVDPFKTFLFAFIFFQLFVQRLIFQSICKFKKTQTRGSFFKRINPEI